MKKISPKQIRILSIVTAFLTCLGILCILLGPISAYGFIKIRDIQYPPGDVMKVIEDIEGNYYYSDGFYSRIQTFDKYGNFKNSWFVNAGGGFFDIDVNDNDQLKVITARNEKEYLFDKTGRLIKTLNNSSFDNKSFSNSGKLKKLHIPFYLWIFCPFLSFSYLFIGIIGAWLIKWYNKKHYKALVL